VQCIRNYFRKKFDYETEQCPSFADIRKEEGVDLEVEASGFTREMQKTFEEALGEDEADDENDSDDEDKDSEADTDSRDDSQVPGSSSCSPSSSTVCKGSVDIADDFASLMVPDKAAQPFMDADTAAKGEVALATETLFSRGGYCENTGLFSADNNAINVADITDGLADLADQNRATKPFRDAQVEKPCSADKLSNSDWSLEVEPRLKPAIDVQVVKQKIKTQHQRQRAKMTARRTVRRGEAAVVTRARRHNNETIQHRGGWDF